jgi:hypothetical protein
MQEQIWVFITQTRMRRILESVERIERRLVESLLYCLGLMGNIYEYNDLLGVQGKVEYNPTLSIVS